MSVPYAACVSALRAVEICSRRTGRTERLLASLRPGMRVICASDREARRLRHEARERGVTGVDFVGTKPGEDPREHFQLMAARKPTVATHGFLHEHWLRRLEAEHRQLNAALDHISGVHLGFERPADDYGGVTFE